MSPRGSPKILFAVLLLFTVLGSTLAFSPPPVFASVGCGSAISTDTTLNTNIGPCLGNGLVIGASGVTLNCAGYTILGTGASVGINSTGMTSIAINLTGTSNATVENCNVTGFQVGFLLAHSPNDTLAENTANNNSLCGFLYNSSKNDIFSDNTADSNGYYGFALVVSTGNTFSKNTANNNGFVGFLLFNSSNSNTLTMNTANNNSYDGFFLWGASNNTFTGNTANSDSEFGYYDYTTGSGTAGTANLYSSNECSDNGVGCSSPSGLCPLISLIPSSGAVGTSVTITGSGLVASHVVTATFGSWVRACPPDSSGSCDVVSLTYAPLTLSGSCTTSPIGSLGGCTFTVPSIPGALSPQHTINMSDGTNSPTATFTVLTPSISLSPSSGAVGTSVTITGSGLNVSHDMTVTYDGSTAGMPTTCTTDASGTLRSGCAFTAPSPSLGNHTITVSDGTNSPTATFTVTLLGVTCSKPSVVVGSRTTCKATIHESGLAAPTGNVTWSSSSSGTFSSASCTLSKHKTYSTCSVKFTPTTAGSLVTLTANYGGDSKNPATAGGHNLIVTRKITKTTVSCTPKSAVAGSSTVITCTAKIVGSLSMETPNWSWSGTGSVSFAWESCTITSLESQQFTCSMVMTGTTAGKVTIQATYSGDSNNMASSGAAKLTIKKAPTVTTVSCTPSPFGIDTPITCTASVSGGYSSQTGTVTFTVSKRGSITSPSNTCTLSSGSCSVMITANAAGSVKVKAAYSGDSNNLKSTGRVALPIV